MNDLAATTASDSRGVDEPCLVAGKHLIPLGIEGRTAMLLARIGGVIGEVGDERLSAVGIDANDYAILAILDTDGPGSQHELAELLGKAPGLLVATIDDLERRKLVERLRDPADRRRSRVALTKAGKRALTRADKVADELIAELFPGLDAAEREQLAHLLEDGLRPPA
jgi:MarR family transcriptional regulator, lower aerobic nicotinate degradation pathway regulator